MKKINIYILSLFLLGLFSLSSCEQLLDVNEDPVNPTQATEEELLNGIEANFSFQVVGGLAARIAAGLSQQTAYGVVQSYDDYFITENSIEGFWNNSSYSGVMANCKILSEQALAKNKKYHAAIAKIIWAQNMAMITDVFGNAPFSQAWQPESYPFPAYDTQEEIFISIHSLLDEAIAHIDDTDQSTEVPGTEDFIYGGNMQKWRKYAYGLKARYYMRLSNAPGYDKVTQSQLVLEAVAQSFTSNDDNAIYQYADQLIKENPWNQYAVLDRWNTFTSPSVDYISNVSKLGRTDIRLALHVRKSTTDKDAFELITNTNGSKNLYLKPEAYNNTSLLGVLYADPDSPLPWLMYSEIKFLEAEAYHHLSNTSSSKQAFRSALEADFSFVRPYLNKISKTPSDEQILANNQQELDVMINTYISNTLEANNYYNELIIQKSIAGFLSSEVYNDFRRVNILLKEQEGSVLKERFGYTGIALRFPYPNSEWQYNPRNVEAQGVPLGFSSMMVPVWWDSAE